MASKKVEIRVRCEACLTDTLQIIHKPTYSRAVLTKTKCMKCESETEGRFLVAGIDKVKYSPIEILFTEKGLELWQARTGRKYDPLGFVDNNKETPDVQPERTENT